MNNDRYQSPAFKLYEGLGFKVVGPTMEFDLKAFGGRGKLRYVTMVREPVSGVGKEG
jgi:hypothetical protein